MSGPIDCPLAAVLAQRLRAARDDLTHRWLDRIAARVVLDTNRIFPTDELLDHIPLLVDGIADYMEDPADEISAETSVVAKAAELGELRLAQGFSASEILKEYEILGGVLFNFLIATVDTVEEECTRGELLACGQRLFRAIAVIQQITTGHYLRKADAQVNEREEQLRSFNRMVTHELKGGLSAVLGGVRMLEEPWITEDPAQRERFVRVISDGVGAMQGVLEDLLALSRMDNNSRRRLNVLLPEAIAESVRQLRTMAEERGVDIRVADDIPPVEVDASAIELCVTNYISNGIKYSDPAKPERWVAVRAYWKDSSEDDAELVIEVRDNGLGVPADAREHVFERYFRSARDAEVEGTGLGLDIVRATMQSIGGRAWAVFDGPSGGSTFSLGLPVRRATDREG